MSVSITVSPQASMESPCLNRIMQPRHPVILSENDWGVKSPKGIAIRFHEHILRLGEPAFVAEA